MINYIEKLSAAKWKGEPCPNHSKGWINDSRGNRLTRLGNRNALGKIIEAHNREIELLEHMIAQMLKEKDDNFLSAECIHGIHPDQCITCTPREAT